MERNKAQIRELLTQYGKVDTLYFDGDTSGLKKPVWELQPDIVVTRSYLKTPEQAIPAEITPGPSETAFVMGTQWGYKATNERFKSGTDLINMLIEIRAKGGNLALDVGPGPSGLLPDDQERLLLEIGLWSFINQEALYRIRPCQFAREGDVWFTQSTIGQLADGVPPPPAYADRPQRGHLSRQRSVTGERQFETYRRQRLELRIHDIIDKRELDSHERGASGHEISEAITEEIRAGRVAEWTFRKHHSFHGPVFLNFQPIRRTQHKGGPLPVRDGDILRSRTVDPLQGTAVRDLVE